MGLTWYDFVLKANVALLGASFFCHMKPMSFFKGVFYFSVR